MRILSTWAGSAMTAMWFTREYEQRRREGKIPAEVGFATKTQIALELLRRQKERGILTASWVGCDSVFGVDSGFRGELAAMGLSYLAATKPKSKVWVEERSVTVAELALEPSLQWQPVILAEGAKGPIAAEVARLRVRNNRDGKPGVEQWLILRRLTDGRLKYYLCNAASQVSERTLWDALARRWLIEQCFEDGQEASGDGSLREPKLDRLAPPHAVRLPGDAVPAAAAAPVYRKLQR